MKLLLHSPRLTDFLFFLGFVGLNPGSASLSVLLSAMTNRTMLLRQKGQTGILAELGVDELGLLWQQRAKTQLAHIWWPQFRTSIVHISSKQMQHRSASPACIRKENFFYHLHFQMKKHRRGGIRSSFRRRSNFFLKAWWGLITKIIIFCLSFYPLRGGTFHEKKTSHL